MLECPRCGIRQYAPASYGAHPRCVACEDLLPSPRRAFPGGRQSSAEILALNGDRDRDLAPSA
jgi:hypothetical protein